MLQKERWGGVLKLHNEQIPSMILSNDADLNKPAIRKDILEQFGNFEYGIRELLISFVRCDNGIVFI